MGRPKEPAEGGRRINKWGKGNRKIPPDGEYTSGGIYFDEKSSITKFYSGLVSVF